MARLTRALEDRCHVLCERDLLCCRGLGHRGVRGRDDGEYCTQRDGDEAGRAKDPGVAQSVHHPTLLTEPDGMGAAADSELSVGASDSAPATKGG